MEVKVSIDYEFNTAFLLLCGDLYEMDIDRAYSLIKEISRTLHRPGQKIVRENIISHYWNVSLGECAKLKEALDLSQFRKIEEGNLPF